MGNINELPEKWYIQVDDYNKEILSNWIGKHNYNLGCWSSVLFDKRATDTRHVNFNYEKITFEQFQNFILKTNKIEWLWNL